MEKPKVFSALNGLRFLGALAVVIFHFGTTIDGYARMPRLVQNFVSEGPAAVGFFFILSGFVLAYRHLGRNGSAEKASDFYWARFVRLYPTYLVAFLLFLPLAAEKYIFVPHGGSAGRHTFLLSAVLSLSMMQSWTSLSQAWNGPSWSLSVEAFMYLVFPLVAARLIRLNRRNTIVMAMAAWLIPSTVALAHVLHRISDSVWHAYVTNNPLVWLPLFVIGICATEMLAPWEKVPRARANWISICAFVALIVAAAYWPHALSDIFIMGGVAPVMAALIVCFTRSTGWLTQVIGGKILSRLGEASYILYILQVPLWHYWRALTNHLRNMPAQTTVIAAWQFFVFVPALIVASLSVQNLVEAPVRKRLTAWKKSRDARKQTSEVRKLNLEILASLDG